MPPYDKKDLIPKKQIVKNLKLKILLIPDVVFGRVFKKRALHVYRLAWALTTVPFISSASPACFKIVGG